MSEIRKRIGEPKHKFSEKPLDERVMLPHEKKAFNMAKDLRRALQKKFFQHPSKHIPIQWAVRTSMDEIHNFGALSDFLNKMDDDAIASPKETQMDTPDQLKDYYKYRGDSLDSKSVKEAFVIVEFNIDYKNVPYPLKIALQFDNILVRNLEKHKPDGRHVYSDSLAQLSAGENPEGSGALFGAKYTFEAK